MSANYLWDLVQIAARIVQLDQLESEITDKREWQAGKVEWEALQEHFNKLRAEYVDALLGDDAPSDGVPAEIEAQLNGLREGADPSWYPAIDYTHQNLMPFLTKEAAKSPRLRKALKAAPFVAAGLGLIAYFGIAIFSATPITQPIETPEGIKQRAAAAEKVIRYDDWMQTRVRRGGWLKGLMLWPIEPSKDEIEGAGEFVGLVFEGQRYAKGCGSVASYGNTLTDEQIDMVGNAADYVQRDDIQWQDPTPLTIVAALESAEQC